MIKYVRCYVRYVEAKLEKRKKKIEREDYIEKQQKRGDKDNGGLFRTPQIPMMWVLVLEPRQQLTLDYIVYTSH